jgi:hypothetical protein
VGNGCLRRQTTAWRRCHCACYENAAVVTNITVVQWRHWKREVSIDISVQCHPITKDWVRCYHPVDDFTQCLHVDCWCALFVIRSVWCILRRTYVLGLRGKKAWRSNKECITLNISTDSALAGAKIGNLDLPIRPRVLYKNVLVGKVRRSASIKDELFHIRIMTYSRL